MSNKSSSSTITSTEVRELLRTAAQQLTAREEKALRMRAGTGLAREQALPRRGQNNADAKAELLALEIELREKLAARGAATTSKAGPAAPVRAKEKDKIIRALRRLK